TIGSRIVKLAGNGAINRHLFPVFVKSLMVSLILLLYVPERIGSALLVEFVNGDEVGKVEHIDFFQLGGCPIFWRHDIEAQIAIFRDLRIALTDAGCLQDYEVKTCIFEYIDGVLNIRGKRQ